MAAGVLVTFLPLAIAGRSAAVATAALFVQPAASTVARWAAGKTGDRRGHAGLLCPGVVLSAAGVAALAVTSSPGLVIGGAAVFGTGFGLLQNATLTLMYARVPATGQDAVSAIWNAAYERAWARARSAGPARRVRRLPGRVSCDPRAGRFRGAPAWRERARPAAARARPDRARPRTGPAGVDARRSCRPPGDGGFRVPRGERR